MIFAMSDQFCDHLNVFILKLDRYESHQRDENAVRNVHKGQCEKNILCQPRLLM